MINENAPNYVKNCVTHHNACDCREYLFKKLEKQNTILLEAVEQMIGIGIDGSYCSALAEKALEKIKESE